MRFAVWGNVELGVDMYAEKGSGIVRLSFGYGRLLNRQDYTCHEGIWGGCARQGGKSVTYFTAEYGFVL